MPSSVPLSCIRDKVTGYLIVVTEHGPYHDTSFEVSLGNVTTTTVIGLLPDTLYSFAAAAAAEDVRDAAAWRSVDLYGRRPLLPRAALGPASSRSNRTATLRWDVAFERFDANATRNASASLVGFEEPAGDEGDESGGGGGAARRGAATLGPSGVVGGEGNYGLFLVGDANVENCNQSSGELSSYRALAVAYFFSSPRPRSTVHSLSSPRPRNRADF